MGQTRPQKPQTDESKKPWETGLEHFGAVPSNQSEKKTTATQGVMEGEKEEGQPAAVVRRQGRKKKKPPNPTTPQKKKYKNTAQKAR